MNNIGYINFEWNEHKAESNKIKHDVLFDDASTVFYDPYARIIDDPDHLITEDRFVIIGLSSKALVLTVCYCLRNNDETIRIISARKATKNESKQYWRYCHEE